MTTPKTDSRPWYRVVNMAPNPDGGTRARIDIYDQIGQYFDWMTWEKAGIAGADFSATLQALGDDITEIELHINSPGGSVVDGLHIYNELKRHPANVIAYIDGQAASIASIIFQAADERIMPANTSQWIHNPMAWFDAYVMGNADDMREAASQALHLADDLDTTAEQLVNIYIDRATDSLTADDVRGMMQAETLITAEEAVEYGFADRLEEDIQMAACKDPVALNHRAAGLAERVVTRAQDIKSEAPQAKGPGDPSPAADPPAPEPAPAPAPIAAKAADIAIACKTAGFPALAVDFIASAVTADQLQAHLTLAGEIRDTLTAAGLEAAIDTTITAGLDGVLPAIRHVLALRLEDETPEIRGEHRPGDQAAHANNVIDIQAVYANINRTKVTNR